MSPWTERVRVAATTALLIAGSLTAAEPACAQGRRPAPTRPVTEVPIHDPVMAREGGKTYVFGTGRGIDVWVTDDMRSWRRLDPVFAASPAWVKDVLPDFRDAMWAPDILEHDGTWYLAYAVSAFGRNNSAIGIATSPTLDPDAPGFGWVDRGILVQSVPGRDMWNAIDPHLVIDEEGAPWMAFGSFWNGIKLVQLDTSLLRVAEPEEWHTIAARNRYWKLDERDAGDSANPDLDYETLYPKRILDLNHAMESGSIEAPLIFPKDGWYYLFVSWDRCCRGVESTYKVVVGRSRDIRGPYLDREGEDMRFGGGSLVTLGFGDSERWAAGGHCDVVTFDGVDHLVFHAYDKSDEGRSKLLVRAIDWDAHGWPTVEVDGAGG